MFKLARTQQHLILGSLVLLWVGVLPWLCWGGWSNPHHPHANPHFVFAPPPLLDDQHAPHDHDAQDALAGVARPDTLFITLLALIFPLWRSLQIARRPVFARKHAGHWSHATTLVVPTPPPRCG